MITASVETWPYVEPFHITGKTWIEAKVLVVEVERDGLRGRGEGFGVYYRGETAEGLLADLARAGDDLGDASRGALIERLPAGGLRNAVDCALWDLEAKLGGAPAWRLAGLDAPRPLPTTITLGAQDPDSLVRTLRARPYARALKLKLNGDGEDEARIQAARTERPDAWIGVDANQGFDQAGIEGLFDAFVEFGVSLVEQPFPVGREAWLDGLRCPVPLAADESVRDLPDLEAVIGRVAYVNFKLDKCGGLTRGFAMAAEARRLGFKLMVGNMGGTTLAMAPAYLLAQVCDLADLDGPTVLRADREPAARYRDGVLSCPPEAWGAAA